MLSSSATYVCLVIFNCVIFLVIFVLPFSYWCLTSWWKMMMMILSSSASIKKVIIPLLQEIQTQPQQHPPPKIQPQGGTTFPHNAPPSNPQIWNLVDISGSESKVSLETIPAPTVPPPPPLKVTLKVEDLKFEHSRFWISSSRTLKSQVLNLNSR